MHEVIAAPRNEQALIQDIFTNSAVRSMWGNGLSNVKRSDRNPHNIHLVVPYVQRSSHQQMWCLCARAQHEQLIQHLHGAHTCPEPNYITLYHRARTSLVPGAGRSEEQTLRGGSRQREQSMREVLKEMHTFEGPSNRRLGISTSALVEAKEVIHGASA